MPSPRLPDSSGISRNGTRSPFPRIPLHEPGDPRPDWFLGLDREVLAFDPVLRELVSSPPSTAEDFTRLAGLLVRHPPAAALLREALSEADLPLVVRESLQYLGSPYPDTSSVAYPSH